MDTYIGLITPNGIIESGKRKLDITSAEVREYGFSKAMKELCPGTWKKPLGEKWEAVFLHLINKYSSRSYLLRGIDLGDAEKLQCGMNAQYSLFTRRLFKEYGIDLEELRMHRNSHNESSGCLRKSHRPSAKKFSAHSHHKTSVPLKSE